MAGKPTTVLAVAAVVGMALWCVGCADTQQQKTPTKPRTIPDQEDETKFDLPAHHFIYRGMEKDRLESLVGRPKGKDEAGQRTAWYYDWGMVLLQDGKVDYKYPPSKGVDDSTTGGGAGQGRQKLPRKQQ